MGEGYYALYNFPQPFYKDHTLISLKRKSNFSKVNALQIILFFLFITKITICYGLSCSCFYRYYYLIVIVIVFKLRICYGYSCSSCCRCYDYFFVIVSKLLSCFIVFVIVVFTSFSSLILFSISGGLRSGHGCSERTGCLPGHPDDGSDCRRKFLLIAVPKDLWVS